MRSGRTARTSDCRSTRPSSATRRIPPREDLRTSIPTAAALYMNWSEYISWRDPRIASYDQYLLTDPANANVSGFASGLEFSRRATQGDLRRLPDAAVPAGHLPRQGAQLEVWGCVRPAHYAELDTGKPQHVRVQFRASGGEASRPSKTVPITDPNGYFDIHMHLLERHGPARMDLPARADDLQPRSRHRPVDYRPLRRRIAQGRVRLGRMAGPLWSRPGAQLRPCRGVLSSMRMTNDVPVPLLASLAFGLMPRPRLATASPARDVPGRNGAAQPTRCARSELQARSASASCG